MQHVHSLKPIRSHDRKSLLTNMDININMDCFLFQAPGTEAI